MSTHLTLGAAAALAGLAALSRAAGSRSSGETRAQLEERLRAQHGVTLHLSGPRWGDAHEPHIVTLDSIVVPASLRSRGTGSAVMRELTAWADAAGHILSLTPAGDFGGSVPRLRRFYKRFGFVRNLGKHKDFRTRDAMIRYPRRGARNEDTSWAPTRHLSVAVRPIGPRETIERVLASKAPVYVIEAPDGQRAEVRGWDLDNHGSVFEGLWRGLSGERLQRELMAFARWLEATPWPMTLWRGTRGLTPPPPPGPVTEQAGPHQGYHWTVSRPIAWRFATGLHSAASNSGFLSPDIHGRIYRAVLDDMDAVNWPQTVYLYYRYSYRKAGEWGRPEVEDQVLVKHHDRLRDVVLQQVEPVPEQLIPGR